MTDLETRQPTPGVIRYGDERDYSVRRIREVLAMERTHGGWFLQAALALVDHFDTACAELEKEGGVMSDRPADLAQQARAKSSRLRESHETATILDAADLLDALASVVETQREELAAACRETDNAKRDLGIVIQNRNAQMERLCERLNRYELGLQRVMEAVTKHDAHRIARGALAAVSAEEGAAGSWGQPYEDAMAKSPGMEKVTHGRHCVCSACKREDWTQPHLAPCGMHGSSCPPVYAPLGAPGEYVPVAGRVGGDGR